MSAVPLRKNEQTPNQVLHTRLGVVFLLQWNTFVSLQGYYIIRKFKMQYTPFKNQMQEYDYKSKFAFKATVNKLSAKSPLCINSRNN